jgi:hypothetical protein
MHVQLGAVKTNMDKKPAPEIDVKEQLIQKYGQNQETKQLSKSILNIMGTNSVYSNIERRDSAGQEMQGAKEGNITINRQCETTHIVQSHIAMMTVLQKPFLIALSPSSNSSLTRCISCFARAHTCTAPIYRVNESISL